MKKGSFFYLTVFVLPLVTIVILLQWLLISPYKKVSLITEGQAQTYLLNERNKTLESDFDLNGSYQRIPVVRQTKNTLSIVKDGGIYQYKRDVFTSDYNLVQHSQEKYSGPKKIAILYISTGKYILFWKKFYEQMEKHFLPRHQKTYFLFTDHDWLKVPKNVVKVHQDQLPWPYITFKRFHFFEGIESELKKFDYVYFLNGTMLPTKDIHEEIFPTKKQKVMVAMHPGYWKSEKWFLPYDRNKKSKAYIKLGEGEYYFMGGFNGGTSEGFLDLIKTCRKWSDIDMQNKQMPVWHDESMLNSYIVNKFAKEGGKPLILSPEYAIPENSEGWGIDEFYPYEKMLIINKKNHGGHVFLRDLKE